MEELNLNDLLDILTENIKMIIIITIILILFGFVYTNIILTPMYSSTTKIILAYSSDNTLTNSVSSTISSDVSLNQKLVSTYSEIIKSKTVVNKVIEKLGLADSVTDISDNITVSPVDDSEVIDITVENEDPYVAASIANSLIEIFSEEVKTIYGIENINQVDVAEASDIPVNIDLISNLVIFGFVGFVLSYGVFFVIKISKTSVQSEEELERITGKQVIAIIPELEEGVL